MKLAYIELAGFRGAKNLLRIDVPAGFLVIAGRNGTGKSTVCDAIEFAFNGSIREHGHKEKGETYADYLWWRGAKPAPERYVRLGFHDPQGVLHEITRTPDGIDNASRKVLALLYSQKGAPNQPLSALARTSLLRDEEITALSVDLPESDRYKFVRDALGTVHLSDLDERLGELRKRFDERLRKETQAYERLRDKVADSTARLSDLRASVASGPENTQVELEMRTLLNLPDATMAELLESARRSLGQERTRLNRLHRLLTSVQELAIQRPSVESKEFTEGQATLQAEVATCEKQLAAIKSECDTLDVEVKHAQSDEPSRAKHADLCNTGESIGLINTHQCPLCGSQVSDQQFRDHISAVRRGIDAAASGLVELLSRQQQAMSQKNAANSALNDAKHRLEEHLAKKRELENLSAQARQEAETQGISVTEGELAPQHILEQIETLRARTRRIESGIGWLESTSIADMIQALESEVAELKTQANEAFAATTRSDKASGKLKEAQKSAKSLLGEIIDEQLAELSPLIEELYKRLRPHVEWTHIRYRLRGDVRRMLSFEVGDGLNPSFVFSSGQRRAAGLAFLLAVHLSRPWCKFESLILDDPVQHVDDFRALNLTEVLTAIRKGGRQIVCCVEDEALGQLMCRRLRSGTESDGRLVKMEYDCEAGVTKSSEVDIGPSRQHILVPA